MKRRGLERLEHSDRLQRSDRDGKPLAEPQITPQQLVWMRPLNSNINGALELYLYVIYFVLNFKMTTLAAMQTTDWRVEARRWVKGLLWSAGKDVEKLDTHTLRWERKIMVKMADFVT